MRNFKLLAVTGAGIDWHPHALVRFLWEHRLFSLVGEKTAMLFAEQKEEAMTMTDRSGTLDRRETASLIGSDKVDGTAVYGSDREQIGSIKRIMIDKISGKVAYAVMSFGGFLGMGEDYYPVPWSSLDYDISLGGYRVNFTNDQLKKAPKYSSSTDWNWNRENDRRVYDYYKARPYWE